MHGPLVTTAQKDIIPIEAARTLAGLFRERVRRSASSVAYHYFDRATSSWRQFTWQDVAVRVARLQQALQAEGITPGERVALWLHNSPAWVAWDQAALAAGLVVVPLYNEDRAENIAYVIENSGAKVVVIQDEARWKRLLPILGELTAVERIFLAYPPERVISDIRVRYIDVPSATPQQTAPNVHESDPHALASIVYTSGTTGRPKGVMLSHHNMLWVASRCLDRIDVYPDDLFLSFLPLSHTLERTAGYYVPMMAGAAVAYSRSIPQLADDLIRVRPTAMISVPRVFERIYARTKSQLAKRTWLADWLFRFTVHTGWRRFEHSQGHRSWYASLLLWPVLDRLVARKFMARLGGRMRLAISGGAALPIEVARLFIGLGLPILQGYGLTETSPVVSANTPEDNDPRSVGRPLRGVELRVGEDQELLVRGPGLMMGYWNNPHATAQVIDRQRWLHTGDQARLEWGRLYITGRIKDILVLSNGEKVAPADMESAIALDPLVEQAMVIGEGRPYLGAIVVLNREAWHDVAQSLALDPNKTESLQDNRVHKRLLARIGAQLRGFPAYAKVRRVVATVEPWTIENGLVTPTLKVRRSLLLAKFAKEIEEVYAYGLAPALA